MGGEKSMAVFWAAVVLGSPPRGRGKGGRYHVNINQIGITPAWAGKSYQDLSVRGYTQDHPRVGGEKASGMKGMKSWKGSPPRGRGKAHHPGSASGFGGITPAWAGKSFRIRNSRIRPGDHPRVGGEKSTFARQAILSRGSPPRGRGKANCYGPPRWGSGITPAWAGKSGFV